MLRRLVHGGRGMFLAAAVVAANFLIILQVTGLSYGRFDWVAFSSVYGPTATPTSTATSTPTETPTATPTATPTNTPKPNGEDCTGGSQCASTICDDGVCCDRICNDPSRCNLAGQRGVCSLPVAPAPTLEGRWLGAAFLLLLSIAALALRSRRRS